MSKQSTLFESWGAKAEKKSVNTRDFGLVDLCGDDSDEDDALLAAALEQSILEQQEGQGSDIGERRYQSDNTWSRKKANKLAEPSTSSRTVGSKNYENDLNTLYSEFTEPFTQGTDATNIEDLPGFDEIAGRMWIYPTNYSVREYQYNIVAKALYDNTLVVLPTGLGKTFIAAVVMYNFYRWYPRGKIIFTAPTKPLVAQQIEACYNIMGIPQSDTAEMTGNEFLFI